MLSSPSFKSPLLLSINSLILSGFPLTFFHLAEAPLSAFLWFHYLTYHKMSFLFIIIHIVSPHFPINLFYFLCKKPLTN